MCNLKEGHVLWYLQSNGEWETSQKRYYGSCFFFGISTKNHHLDSHAGVDMSRPAKKDYASTGR